MKRCVFFYCSCLLYLFHMVCSFTIVVVVVVVAAVVVAVAVVACCCWLLLLTIVELDSF